MGYHAPKTEAGSCTPSSQAERWDERADVKAASKRKRRQNDRREIKKQLETP